MSITLRPYQQDAIRAVQNDWAAGYTDVLGVMATGGGKTAVFLSLLREQLQAGERALVLAHRKELIQQPVERLYSYYPEWQGRAGIVMADTNEPDRPITVATIQTLAASPRRLEEILRHGPIDYMITDEAHHHTDKNTYMAVTQKLREANPELRHLGVTATPIRADGDGLAGVFQKESFHYDIQWMIRNQSLVPIRWLAIEAAVSLDGIKTVHGDFQRSALGLVYETPELLGLVVESYRQYASDRQAIAFTVTVDGAHKLERVFRQAGVNARAADGETDKKTRQQILDDFSAGRIQVLCNVGLYTEGLDVPQTGCILQARPTKSDGLYVQMIGRALRLFPGKEDALILDFAPVDKRNVVMAGDVLGVPLPRKEYLPTAGAEQRGMVQAGFTFDGEFTWMDGSPVQILSRQLNYLNSSPWSWYRRDGWMSLGLGKGRDEVERTLVLTPACDGQVILYGVAKRPGGSWQAYELAAGPFEDVEAEADRYSDKHGNAALAAKQRSWRKEPPTDAQLKYARRLKGAWRAGMTKGELAQSITHVLALQALEGPKIGMTKQLSMAVMQ